MWFQLTNVRLTNFIASLKLVSPGRSSAALWCPRPFAVIRRSPTRGVSQSRSPWSPVYARRAIGERDSQPSRLASDPIARDQ